MGGNSTDGRIIKKGLYRNINPLFLMKLFRHLYKIERSDSEIEKVIVR